MDEGMSGKFFPHIQNGWRKHATKKRSPPHWKAPFFLSLFSDEDYCRVPLLAALIIASEAYM